MGPFFGPQCELLPDRFHFGPVDLRAFIYAKFRDQKAFCALGFQVQPLPRSPLLGLVLWELEVLGPGFLNPVPLPRVWTRE